ALLAWARASHFLVLSTRGNGARRRTPCAVSSRYLVVGYLIPEAAVVLGCDERFRRDDAGVRRLKHHHRMLAPAVRRPRWRGGRGRITGASEVRPLRQQLVLQCRLVGASRPNCFCTSCLYSA